MDITPSTPFQTVLIALCGWLAGPSFAIAISQLLETIPQFHSLDKQTKFLLSTLLTGVGTVIGYLLGSSPQIAAIPQNNPTLATLLVGIGFVVVQVWHTWSTRQQAPPTSN